MKKPSEQSLPPQLEAQWLAAVKKGDVVAVQELLRAGVTVDSPIVAAGGKTALAVAEGERGDAARAMAVALLEAGADFKKGKIDLVWATYFRLERAVPILIARGADVNQKGGMGPPLLRAAAYGLGESVERLIAAGADVNAGSLPAAVEGNHTQIVKMLLHAGAKPQPGQNLLATAIQKDNQEVAVALVEAGAELNERSDVGGSWADPGQAKTFAYATPLIMAAAAGQKQVVEALLQAGADVHLADKAGATAWDWATNKGQTEVAAMLEAAARRQPRTVDPSVDLLYAAEKGQTDMVKELLAAGARVGARDVRPGSSGFTPLMLAARSGHAGTVEALLAAGAEVDARDDNEPRSAQGFAFVVNEMGVDGATQAGFQMHRTSLHWAAEKHAAVVEVLLRHGAAVELVDRAKMTPLMLAAAGANGAAVAVLLRAGADVNVKGRKKQDALYFAAEAGDAEVVRQLLTAGADPKARDADGHTALMMAARQAKPDVVAALLEGDADVHAVNREKGTALAEVAGHRLRANKHVKGEGIKRVLLRPAEEMLETARLLVDAGADPWAKDKQGASPMSLAERGLADVPFYARMIALFKAAKPQAMEAAPARKAARVKPPKPRPVAAPAKAPDFSQAARAEAFQAALAELEKRCGAQRQPMEEVPGGFAFGVHSCQAAAFDFAEVQAQLLQAGCFIFYTQPQHGEPIGALPTRDPYDALLAMQTNGVNSDVMPEDIVAWLRETERDNALVLTGVGRDFVEGRFVGKVKKPGTLARRMARLCPDADGEIEGLAEDLKQQGKLFLWWD